MTQLPCSPSAPARIGILGGAGPLASALFHQRLVEQCQAHRHAKLDHEFPEILHLSRAYPGLDARGVQAPSAAKDALQAGINSLLAAGCTLIAIPCNSLHVVTRDLQVPDSVRMLDQVQLVSKRVAASGARRVKVLCSDSSRRDRLFEDAFLPFGIKAVFGGAAEQELVNYLIEAGMAGHVGLDSVHLLGTLLAPSPDWDAVLLGCTELSLHHWGAASGGFDSLTILAEETIKEAFHESL